ncbi:hypothetical protein SAY87_017425 [Trapa incisa]|uniref:Uncharacterized protein n=1 Tax=Trapa incisa TaxID=236973 RepID=A0AAN7LBY2_9MYRT|nr:hypothetical protein SAY87_017425 [Trapa incisa]
MSSSQQPDGLLCSGSGSAMLCSKWNGRLTVEFLPWLSVAQDVQDQEEARKEDEAEQADPPLDPHEDGQHDQV